MRTVPSPIHAACAMPRLSRPSATNLTTSRSRFVSWGNDVSSEGDCVAEAGIVVFAPRILGSQHEGTFQDFALKYTLATHDGAQRRGNSGDVLLDEISARALPQCAHDVFIIRKRGEKDDAGIQMGCKDSFCRFQVADLRHLNVEKRDIGEMLLVNRNCVSAGRPGANHLYVFLGAENDGKR